MENSKSANASFKIDFEGMPDKKLPLKVFVFDRNDKLIESQNIDGNSFNLKTDEKTLRQAQVYIAPNIDAVALNPQPLPPRLREIGAYRPVFELDENQLIQRSLLPIPEAVWQNWHFCSCRIRGQVVKPFHIPTPFGGFTINVPVCHARVHICRLVPRIYLLKDFEIFKLRDDILRVIEPVVIPRPRPGDPPPFLKNVRSPRMDMMMDEMSNEASFQTMSNLTISTTFQNQLQTGSAGSLRQILIDNIREIQYHPHFCWLFNCVEVAVTETDSQGRFDRRVWENCFNPNHNYYIWVEYLINGVWESVYQPNYCFGAFWNYACGTDITITVNDPRIPLGCRPTVTGSFLEIVSVGTSGIVSLIQQPTAAPDATTLVRPLSGNNGLINLALGDGVDYRPFGAHLAIYANFGDAFPSNDATHYRISYKKHTDNGTVESNWHPLSTSSLSRWYREEITTGTITTSVVKEFPLLDNDGVGYYKIPHEDAKNQPELNNKCVWSNDVFAIGILNTLPLENNFYDIRVEMYKKNSPTDYRLASVAKTVYQMPVLNASNVEITSKPCDDNYLTTVTKGGVTTPAFMMTIRIDNNLCAANIENVTISGIPASDECGFLDYTNAGNAAQLQFKASHPYDFATYNFRVVRGNNNDMAGLSTHGKIDHVPLNGFVNSDTTTIEALPLLSPTHKRTFTKATTVADLLNGLSPACLGNAAFAQRLNVWATATDGNQRLSIYDAPEQLAAFAIVNTPPSE